MHLLVLNTREICKYKGNRLPVEEKKIEIPALRFTQVCCLSSLLVFSESQNTPNSSRRPELGSMCEQYIAHLGDTRGDRLTWSISQM